MRAAAMAMVVEEEGKRAVLDGFPLDASYLASDGPVVSGLRDRLAPSPSPRCAPLSMRRSRNVSLHRRPARVLYAGTQRTGRAACSSTCALRMPAITTRIVFRYLSSPSPPSKEVRCNARRSLGVGPSHRRSPCKSQNSRTRPARRAAGTRLFARDDVILVL